MRAWPYPAGARVRLHAKLAMLGVGMVALGAPVASAQRPASATASSPTRVEGFASASRWSLETVEDVDASIHADSGGLRLDVDFHGHGGAVTLHTDQSFDLPANYELRIPTRGTITVPLLELRLIDTTDENQWESTSYHVAFPQEWTTLHRQKRQLGFVRGAAGTSAIRRVGALELRLGGRVGKGSIWLRDLTVVPVAAENPFEPVGGVLSSGLATARSAAVGTWEQSPVPHNGVGVTLALADDGSMVMTRGAMFDAAYEVAGGQLTTRVLTSTGTTDVSVDPIHLRHDTLVVTNTASTGPDRVMVRVRPAASGDSSLVGEWSYPYNDLVTAFVAYTRDGQMHFRLPIRSEAGTWQQLSADAGRLSPIQGQGAPASWTLAGDVLMVTDPRGMVIRFRRQPGIDEHN